MSNSYCKEKNCGEIGVLDNYCVRHFQIHRKRNTNKYVYSKPWHKLYYTDKWKRLRAKKQAQTPLCEFCNAVGVDIDHIVDHKGDLKLFYDMSNLQTLCKECHGRKTSEDLTIARLRESHDVVTIHINTNLDEDKIDRAAKALGVKNITPYVYRQVVIGTSGNDFIIKNKKRIRLLRREYMLHYRVKPVFEIYE